MRSALSQAQKEFLEKITPVGRHIQKQLYSGTRVIKPIYSPRGIHASIIIAEILVSSDWGTHPAISVNNLALLIAGPYWKGKTVEFDRVKYKSFSDWHEYTINYTDTVIFTVLYEDVLRCLYHSNQIHLLEFIRTEIPDYYEQIYDTIEKYELKEFDLWPVEAEETQ